MKSIPYSRQSIAQDDIRAVVKVLKSDWITQGPKIAAFEEALCEYTGAKFAVCVSSGTAALHIACLAAGIKRGDEIITSAYTFAASANCILYCGAKPVFADIQPATGNIDPAEIEKKIGKKTRGIIPVHFAGQPCELQEIRSIARKHKLLVIEDAAHALGAGYKGSKIGACKYSDMTIFSFHPLKSITTAEGGAVLTNKKDLYEKLLMLRNHGITKDPGKLLNKAMAQCGWHYEMQNLGFNYRITDLQSALGISQLKKIEKFIKARRGIAEFYNRSFRDNPYFDVLRVNDNVSSAYHLYPIRLRSALNKKKKEIFAALKESGLGVQVHYIPVYQHPYYKKSGFIKCNCHKAEDLYSREISIPIFPALKPSQAQYVASTILKVCKKFKKA